MGFSAVNSPEVKEGEMDSPDSSGIALSVERGQATDEELAALTVVLLALRADREQSPERQAVSRLAVVAARGPVQRPTQLAVRGPP